MSLVQIKLSDHDGTSCVSHFIGLRLYEFVCHNSGMQEYDTQLIEDKTVLIRLVDEHYLLVNKCYMKEFLAYWKNQFLSRGEAGGSLLTVCCVCSTQTLIESATFN